MLCVDRSWIDLFEAVKNRIYFKKIFSFLREEEQKGHTIYPHSKNFFRAFEETPLPQVRVVILGQDPYHGPGQADGLCFSVPDGISFPPSLKNLFKELSADVDCSFPISGSLEPWAQQGVLLLNSCLSVRAGQPLSHRKIGWEFFIQAALDFLWERTQPLAFILWGKAASSLICRQEKIGSLSPRLLVKSAHPSPLSAHCGFWGSRPFTRVNQFLVENNCLPIEWERISQPDLG